MPENSPVYFIGDVALDEYYQAPYFPKVTEKILVQTLPAQMGGMIANAACVYASYGAPAAFLAALNSGPTSAKLCEGLRDAGLDTAHIVWDDTLPDSKCIIILAEDEHTVFIPTMNLQQLELSAEAMRDIIRAGYVYSTFCELRPLRHGGLDACGVLSHLRDNGVKLWCDLDVADIQDGDEALFPFVDTLFLNENGYKNLEARAGGDVAAWLFGKGVRLLVVTKAASGCEVLYPGGETLRVPGHSVPVVDVTGAGDTFCASFLYAYTKTNGTDIALCADFANWAAARAVTQMGARGGAAGLAAVLEFIQQQGGGAQRFAALQ